MTHFITRVKPIDGKSHKMQLKSSKNYSTNNRKSKSCHKLFMALGSLTSFPAVLLTFQTINRYSLIEHKFFNKAVMELLTIFNRIVMGYSWCIHIDCFIEHIKHWGMHVLVCLANNWPWLDHSNIASYGPVGAYIHVRIHICDFKN